jgi:hypothetical protein
VPKFKVEIERIVESGLPPNPFRALTIDLSRTSRSLVRSWEFEAKDEAEVRRLFKEAQEQKLPNVVGFRLRSITLSERDPNALKNRRQECTCVGLCKGPEGLGEGWVCAMGRTAASARTSL